MQTDGMTDTLAVTQEDRDAADKLKGWISGGGYVAAELIQAFARHRIAAEQRARIEGARAERAQLIAWLRSEASANPLNSQLVRYAHWAGDAIERGDHLT